MAAAAPTSPFDYRDGLVHNFTVLSEDELSKELSRLAHPLSIGSTDVATFQPCSNPADANQDRYVVQDWTIGTSLWRLQAVFDGHAGHEAVDYAMEEVPLAIKDALVALLSSDTGIPYDPVIVSRTLRDAIQTVDDGIAQALYDIFPDPDSLHGLSDDEIKTTINDGGKNSATVLRCMRGTTVLVSLFDTERKQLWVASLGDCQAVLGTKESAGWTVAVLSSNHNGTDASEAARVQAEHPGEEEAMLDDRVLGAIAVTRALGDHTFKLHRTYTERVFLNSEPGYRVSSSIEAVAKRNHTPPYVSNLADVQHVVLPADKEHWLVLCSDGLPGCYEPDTEVLPDLRLLGEKWFGIVADFTVSEEAPVNRAIAILRDALGGADLEAVSKLVTLERPSKWMDDVTVLVARM